MIEYEYRCPVCGTFDSEEQQGAYCPWCGERGKRVYSSTPMYSPSKTQPKKKRTKE